MDLKTYTNSLPHGGAAAFARKLGVTRVYLSQLSARQHGRLPSPALCVRIEQESAGAVTRKEMRPEDWHELWPELIDQRRVDLGPAARTTDKVSV